MTNNAASNHQLEPELLPCPFCDEVPTMQSHTQEDEMDEGRYVFFVECGNGKCPMGLVSTGGPYRSEADAAKPWNSRVSVGGVVATVAPEADRIILSALKTHGSEVIFDSENGTVVACPVSSLCEGTADHGAECWIGAAMRYMPTSDCERAVAAPATPADQCPATCTDFSLYCCPEPHRCVLDAGHPFDPFQGSGIHEFETHATTVKPRTTSAAQKDTDFLKDAGAIIVVSEGNAGARVEIRFAELEDAQRLHNYLVRTASKVESG